MIKKLPIPLLLLLAFVSCDMLEKAQDNDPVNSKLEKGSVQQSLSTKVVDSLVETKEEVTILNELTSDAQIEETSDQLSEKELWDILVEKTHKASKELRLNILRETIKSPTYWIKGAWGETLWALSALYLNEKTEIANQTLLLRAEDYTKGEDQSEEFLPENSTDKTPWSYFALTDYVRIVYLFGQNSEFFPGRLQPETEDAMMEALWTWARQSSRVDKASENDLLTLLGTENHDLTLRPNYYLTAYLFSQHPNFKDRLYNDGYTAADHCVTYSIFFREWAKIRAMYGMWVELGSDKYQKYSWPNLVNLAEFAPDALVRKRFRMLLDIALIEEEQISVQGRRGGGRSRAEYGKNNFEGYKALFYGDGPGSSHSKVIETSSYQAPLAAILLRKETFPVKDNFIIKNRVLGEEIDNEKYTQDSALVNYAYRTPHYLLGSTLQDPSLTRIDTAKNTPVLKYAGISRQKRWAGVLFDDPEAERPSVPAHRDRSRDEMCAVYVKTERKQPGKGGRPQHPHWSVQYENVLILQRIQEAKGTGSYNTGKVSICFHGKGLLKEEKEGWIFASNDQAYVAVKFLDSEHEWDESGEIASPKPFIMAKPYRYLMHCGDKNADGSFAEFQNKVLANPLEVTAESVQYTNQTNGTTLVCYPFIVAKSDQFRMPSINGKEINIKPDMTYSSPFLNLPYGESKVKVSVGAYETVYDFASEMLN